MNRYGRSLWVMALGAGLSMLVLAQELKPGAFGTRGSAPVRITAPAAGGYAWVQMTVALVLVALALRYGLPRLIGWAGKAGVGSRLDGQIRVLESRAVPGGSLLLVKARDHLLLIGATPQSMQLIADLTPSPVPSPPLGERESEPLLPSGERAGVRGSEGWDSQPFEQALRSAERNARGIVPADWQQEVASELQNRIQQARARLKELCR